MAVRAGAGRRRPLGPENVLIFGTGTLTGTSAPSSRPVVRHHQEPGHRPVPEGQRRAATWARPSSTPATTTSSSQGGSPKPVYLWIDDDKVELRDAAHLWGKGTRETDDLIKEELGDPTIQTGVIGPAGENRVKFACFMVSRYNAAARGGVGAVFGSKNLKAIACRGTGGLRPAQGKKFFALARKVRGALAADAGSESLYNWGTAGRSRA